jgi:hypothetical protein
MRTEASPKAPAPIGKRSPIAPARRPPAISRQNQRDVLLRWAPPGAPLRPPWNRQQLWQSGAARRLPRSPAKAGETFCAAPRRGACHSPFVGAPVPMQPEAVPRHCAPVPAIPRECPPEPTRPVPARRAAGYAAAPSLERQHLWQSDAVSRPSPPSPIPRSPAISRDLPRAPASACLRPMHAVGPEGGTGNLAQRRQEEACRGNGPSTPFLQLPNYPITQLPNYGSPASSRLPDESGEAAPRAPASEPTLRRHIAAHGPPNETTPQSDA